MGNLCPDSCLSRSGEDKEPTNQESAESEQQSQPAKQEGEAGESGEAGDAGEAGDSGEGGKEWQLQKILNQETHYAGLF